MGDLSNIGRIFYGIVIAVLGFLTIYYKDFPYMLIPSSHAWINGFAIVAYISGTLLVIAGGCIAFEIAIIPVSILLGSILLLVFCFYFIPYELIASPNYMHFGDWENAAKELALSSGGFVIAASFYKKNNIHGYWVVRKLLIIGPFLFAITILSFGIDHFLFAKEASDYVPAWIPGHLFWMYFTGSALIGASLAIACRIKTALFATLLGTMIFLWFIMLHIPRIIVSPIADLGGEIASACLALGYCGIAFVIAGTERQQAP